MALFAGDWLAVSKNCSGTMAQPANQPRLDRAATQANPNQRCSLWEPRPLGASRNRQIKQGSIAPPILDNDRAGF